VFYISAQCFLPKGNFAYIEQIPHLYIDFCEANNTKDVFEFLEEQFLEIGFDENDADEPYEKESKSVPFHTPSAHSFVAFLSEQTTEFSNTETTRTHHFIYILKEHWVHAPSIYHPPKTA